MVQISEDALVRSVLDHCGPLPRGGCRGANAGKAGDRREDRPLFSGGVASPDNQGRLLGLLKRFFRWNPVNYWQVWLLCALPLIPVLRIRGLGGLRKTPA